MRVWLAIGAALLAATAETSAIAQGRAAGLRGNPGQFFGPDDYPPEALRAREEGRAVARLGIDSTGKVATCTITSSSNSPSLDAKTCEIALEKVSFTPALDHKGRPIAATYILPVRWILPNGPEEVGAEPMKSMVNVTVAVDSDSKVVACNFVTDPEDRGRFDFCHEFPVGGETQFRYVRQGRRVGGTFVRTMTQEFKPDP